jgi:hypothetical protein
MPFPHAVACCDVVHLLDLWSVTFLATKIGQEATQADLPDAAAGCLAAPRKTAEHQPAWDLGDSAPSSPDSDGLQLDGDE